MKKFKKPVSKVNPKAMGKKAAMQGMGFAR